MKKTTNKTDRLDLRVSPEQKEFVEMQAKKQNKNKTEYILSLIEQDSISISHEQLISNSLSENQFINDLLTHPDISNKDKQIIGKEIRKYV
jgi:uncharacterized protein (DUF1778 family)